jgi:hypothetical protein
LVFRRWRSYHKWFDLAKTIQSLRITVPKPNITTITLVNSRLDELQAAFLNVKLPF